MPYCLSLSCAMSVLNVHGKHLTQHNISEIIDYILQYIHNFVTTSTAKRNSIAFPFAMSPSCHQFPCSPLINTKAGAENFDPLTSCVPVFSVSCIISMTKVGNVSWWPLFLEYVSFNVQVLIQKGQCPKAPGCQDSSYPLVKIQICSLTLCSHGSSCTGPALNLL